MNFYLISLKQGLAKKPHRKKLKNEIEYTRQKLVEYELNVLLKYFLHEI